MNGECYYAWRRRKTGLACVQWPVPLDALDTRHVSVASATGRVGYATRAGHVSRIQCVQWPASQTRFSSSPGIIAFSIHWMPHLIKLIAILELKWKEKKETYLISFSSSFCSLCTLCSLPSVSLFQLLLVFSVVNSLISLCTLCPFPLVSLFSSFTVFFLVLNPNLQWLTPSHSQQMHSLE